jgi:hypothetical protein
MDIIQTGQYNFSVEVQYDGSGEEQSCCQPYPHCLPAACHLSQGQLSCQQDTSLQPCLAVQVCSTGAPPPSSRLLG